MPFCLIGLGSNQGNRQHLLETASARIAAESQVRIIALSPWHETTPIGGPPGQPLFLNGALTIKTSLSPQQLLALLLQIERDFGRQREERWASRSLDLDLLLYDDLVLDTPSLQLPHPRMAWRRFVLEPAAEVAGAMIHPTIGWTVTRLLEHLNSAPRYIAIAGPIAVGKSHLARRLAESLSARLITEKPNWQHLTAFYNDPTGHGWQMELEFLNQRALLLAAILQPAQGMLPTGESCWTVSDFWFDQSRAFARTWLPPGQLPAFIEQWQEKRLGVIQPKLLVHLDAPAEMLLARLRARNRSCEQQLTEEQLERIRQAIFDEVSQPNVGPVLRLNNDDHDAIFAEVLAAVQGME